MEVIFQDVVLILLLASGAIFLCHWIRLPSAIALMATGILIGPKSVGLIENQYAVKYLAEIGVILLLFGIGVEFSLRDLWKMKTMVILGGTLQVCLTSAGVFLLFWSLDFSWKTSLICGFLIAPSSTALVLKILQERGDIFAPQGRASLSILIYQDIAIVPMMLVLPLLGMAEGSLAASLGLLALKALAIVALTLISAVWVVPWIMEQIVKTRNQELFLLSVVLIALATAFLTYKMGLSLELGAFLAGLTISESRYSHQALAGIIPFRQVFMAFFFVSIGMLLDIHFALGHLGIIGLAVIGVILFKFLVIFFALQVLRISVRISILTGLALAQVGEFSLILALAARGQNLLADHIYQPFLAVVILSMAITPFMIAFSQKISQWGSRLLFFLDHGEEELSQIKKESENHLIIVGFGLNGNNLAHAARVAELPYLILELNPTTVREEREKGEPIYYGDATHGGILEHAYINKARLLVVAISDSLATRKIVSLARSLNPSLHIIARTRFVSEVEALYNCGADEVIPEEFETSVEIFTRVLNRYLVPEDKIRRLATQVRENNYQILRNPTSVTSEWEDLKSIPELDIATFHLDEDQDRWANRKLGDLEFRQAHNITILAIRREGNFIADVSGETEISPGDDLVAMGNEKALTDFSLFLRGEEEERETG